MSDFQLYLQLGLEHIADLEAYDHILFVLALCSVYSLKHWKAILTLVTAFTIGHSITLILTALKYIPLHSEVVELLIPITIFVTAILNIIQGTNINTKQSLGLKYALALIFGCIHGMGFSNFFQGLLGQEENIVLPLLSFNIGIEIGQLGIVVISVLVANIITYEKNPLRLSMYQWNILDSSIIAALALMMIVS